MSIVIVTRNQYLLASKIHHITMNENREYVDIRNKQGRYRSIRQDSYTISVYYTAEVSNNSSFASNNTREETRSCEVSLRGKVDAYKVYADLIRQIREQSPDQLFLDKALEDLLSQTAAELVEVDRDPYLLESDEDDKRTTKVRKPRKAKRRSKKVLRKSKARR